MRERKAHGCAGDLECRSGLADGGLAEAGHPSGAGGGTGGRETSGGCCPEPVRQREVASERADTGIRGGGSEGIATWGGGDGAGAPRLKTCCADARILKRRGRGERPQRSRRKAFNRKGRMEFAKRARRNKSLRRSARHPSRVA